MLLSADKLDLFLLEDVLWLTTALTHVPAYDFDFGAFFPIRRPWEPEPPLQTVGRFGAATNYNELFTQLQERGAELVHSPEMHVRASELPAWHPLIADLTPRSRWFSAPPSIQEIEASFAWPVFIKGSRQTSRHQKALSIIGSREEYALALDQIRHDPILHWQALVVREFVPLRPIEGGIAGKIPASFEFRTFWWRGQCVGEGRYYTQAPKYQWTAPERKAALAIARAAVQRVEVTFLVVDLAQCGNGSWIVIELNDGQESGYAGVPPVSLWQNIVAIERKRLTETKPLPKA
jgi:hypothetical protein